MPNDFRVVSRGSLNPDDLDGNLAVRKFMSGEVSVPVIKATDSDNSPRIIDFVVSSGKVDREGDKVHVSGFETDHYMNSPVVLFAHRMDTMPIGRTVSLKKGTSMRARIEFAPPDVDTTGFSDVVYRMLAAGYLNGASVGFLPMEWEKSNEPTRKGGIDFIKQSLIEISIVPVPADPNAVATALGKGLNVRPLRDWVEGILDDWDVQASEIPVHKGSLLAMQKALTPRSYKVSRSVQDSLLERNLAAIRRASDMEDENLPGESQVVDLSNLKVAEVDPDTDSVMIGGFVVSEPEDEPDAQTSEATEEVTASETLESADDTAAGEEEAETVSESEDKVVAQPVIAITPARRKSLSVLPQIATRVFNTPLLIHPDKLQAIMSFLGERVGLSPEDMASVLVSGQPDMRDRTRPESGGSDYKIFGFKDGIATIPVTGTLVHRGAWVGRNSGMTSYEGLTKQLDAAMADDDVEAVLFDIDSPGGEASGCFSFSNYIADCRKKKPVYSMVNDDAYSAAYAIAAAGERVFVTPHAGTGSVGVYMMHVDQSARVHNSGQKVTIIHAGKHKVEGNPLEALSEEGRERIQGMVNDTYSLFVSSVAANRGLDEDHVRSTEALTYRAKKSVDIGFADEVIESWQVHSRIKSLLSEPSQANNDQQYTLVDLEQPNPMMPTMATIEEVELDIPGGRMKLKGVTYGELEKILSRFNAPKKAEKSINKLDIREAVMRVVEQDLPDIIRDEISRAKGRVIDRR